MVSRMIIRVGVCKGGRINGMVWNLLTITSRQSSLKEWSM